MALEVIGREMVRVPHQKSAVREKIEDFFTTIGELFELYFASPGTIASLDPKNRAHLTEKKKAESDVSLLLIRR